MLAAVAPAAETIVRAGVSRGITVIGEPVQYQIKITNARRTGAPPEAPVVDGLEFRYLGPSTSVAARVDASGFYQEKTTSHIYAVNPTKNGTYTIPAVEVDVDGRRFKTEPIVLTVQQSSAEDETKPRAQGTLEIVLPKTTAYVGETIPVEVRLYVDARVHWQLASMPTLDAEGFTRQKFPEPRPPEVVPKNGLEYDLVIFKTSISPSKAGKMTLGPAEITYNAQVPRARRAAPKSLLDLFDDDVFGDLRFSEVQKITVASKPVELTVKPLPAAGQPPGFAGAVGKFEFSASGTPAEVKVGDPVTMKLQVSGRGNFDRVEAPALKDSKGWRSYPPSGIFTKDASDPIGISGIKKFEIAVVPEEQKTQMPAFAFSYFDPETEKYVTLSSDPAPLKVQGTLRAPAPSVRATEEPLTAKATPMPAAPAAPEDIHGVVYELGVRKAFRLLYESREFWIAQSVPAAALLLLAGLRLRRPRTEAVLRRGTLRREKATLLTQLRGGRLAHAEFFNAAARVLQIDTALATGAEASSVDAAAVRALAPDFATAEVIDEVFNARAELLFAGGGREEVQVSSETRGRVLSVLETMEKAHAKS
jgi:hypothetical protein